MTNFKIRILFFLISVPIVFSIIFFFPHYKFLLAIIFMSATGVICGFEFKKLLVKIDRPIPQYAAFMPAIPPIISWLINMNFLPSHFSVLLLISGVYWALSEGIFSSKNPVKDDSSYFRDGGNFLILFYPTWFFWWMARLTWYENATMVLSLFMLTVIVNDSMAWFFGMLFGRHKGIFAVSPNKSLEGYLAGIISASGMLIVTNYFFNWYDGSMIKLLVLSFIIVAMANCGDLFESRIKRYARIKDSGKIMSVRGGMLDSIDSWLFTAPAFNLLFSFTT